LPVGRLSLGGICHPLASSRRTEALSTVYSQGENIRTCPQFRRFAPIVVPASKTIGVSPRSRRCAAAASPTGPAPIIATGTVSLMLLNSNILMNIDLNDERQCRLHIEACQYVNFELES